MGNITKKVSLILVSTFTLIGYQNCGGKFDPAIEGTNTLEEYSQSAKFDCQFVGVQALRTRLSGVLSIPSQDVFILNDNGRPTNQGRIETAKYTLGEANPAVGKYADYSCEMAKFKTSAEIMIDACRVALESDEVKARLFPQGNSNFDELYLTFLGRFPSMHEEQVLANLSNSMPEELKEAAACAATAMSFEALTRI